MGGFSIGIGLGIRRQVKPSGATGGSPSPGETSCYATGVWIMSGTWGMDDTWRMQPEQSAAAASRAGTKATRTARTMVSRNKTRRT